MGEADVRLTVVTREFGRITVKAPGLRKITSRRAPYLDLFQHVKLFLTAGRTFNIITDVESYHGFEFLRTRLNRIGMAYKLTEICDRLLPENEAHFEVFDALLMAFRKLNDEKSEAETVGDNFCLDLLKKLGYQPQTADLSGDKLNRALEEVMEKEIRSLPLLTKIKRSLR
ncbi:MAG: repair protein RecO, DNA repair protein RecO (recombination protein O) protein [Candidatus Gottesmanbacteria bacterium GW2011_GWA2_43_14]|uniref:DNA repair protein RecO n=1 Tax=Candidatus Gottesmanbacteria bacterium GW2011_GWA2_43_14 TaxID=1618443 RepID=A0A0G1DLT5_9BACT|nr:MAG: repair protein RecO, DNA repair protein RecO (recombination protein O) protein [Candidatus Gottesmanbacteria bacterium GW2011_GWA2_43_14]